MFGKEQAEAPVVLPNPDADIDLSGPVTLNLDAIRDEPVVEGWHTVKIERADAKLSRQKQLPSIFVLSRVTDEGDVEYNRTVIWNLMLEGDGMVFTKRCFAALGLTGELNYPSYQDMASDLVGREVEVKVKHRVYKGVKQAQVNNWKACTPEVYY